MTTDPRNGAAILSPEECWERLNATTLGRLAVVVAGEPDIFPLNYVVIENRIYLRTTEGSKLAAVAINNKIAFEIDGLDEPTNLAWSIVVHGMATILEHQRIVDEIESLPWFPWNKAPKNQFIEISPTGVSGRAFVAHGRTSE